MDRTSKYRRIVIKAGSNVLTRDDGRPTPRAFRPSWTRSPGCTAPHRGDPRLVGRRASGRSVLEQRTGRIDTVSARQLFSP